MQPRGQLWFALENICKDFRNCSGLDEKEALETLVVVLTNMLAEQKADLEQLTGPQATGPALSDTQARLHDISRLLRDSNALDPETRSVLAELVDALTATLQASNAPAAEVAHLAASAAHLAESLHHQQDQGLLAKARDRFGVAALQAEARAPIAAGVARRLLDALANIGI